MFDVLSSNGLLNKYDGPDFEPNISGYQIPSDVIVWKAADGTVAAWNPVEMPNLPMKVEGLIHFSSVFIKMLILNF